MFYKFVNGSLRYQSPPIDCEPEDAVDRWERDRLMEEDCIGYREGQIRPGKMNRGYAGQDAWKRLLPEDYSF